MSVKGAHQDSDINAGVCVSIQEIESRHHYQALLGRKVSTFKS